MSTNEAGNNTVPYKYSRAFTPAEQEVVDLGYPYVQTNTLGPKSTLGTHQHSSLNIHVPLEGSMKIKGTQGNQRWTVLERNQDGYFVFEVHAGIPYRAESEHGVTFIEGHEKLSPATAERFTRAPLHTLVRADPGDKDAFWGPEPAARSTGH